MKKPKKAPKVQSEEDYLIEKGLSSSVSDYSIDKTRIPHGETRRQREKRIKASEEATNKYFEERAAARAEYKKKVARGEIREPTTIEKAMRTAHGHEDNAATQAARRILAKQGIDWETGKKIKNKEQKMKDDKKKKPTAKKSVKRPAKPAAKKTTAKKPAKTSKPSAAKKPAAKKVTAKKPTVKTAPKQSQQTTSKAKFPKHSDKEERKVGTERPIIINGKAKAPKHPQTAQPTKAAVTQRQGRVSSVTYHIRYD